MDDFEIVKSKLNGTIGSSPFTRALWRLLEEHERLQKSDGQKVIWGVAGAILGHLLTTFYFILFKIPTGG